MEAINFHCMGENGMKKLLPATFWLPTLHHLLFLAQEQFEQKLTELKFWGELML